jgi:hypothetical protein
MNVEIGAEAAQFPEKEYINEIAVAVYKFKDIIYGAGIRDKPTVGTACIFPFFTMSV